MVIAVNTRVLLMREKEGYVKFLHQVLRLITGNHPTDNFIFLFDRDLPEDLLFPPNVKAIVAAPKAKGPLFWKYWYDVRVPALLKKHQADIFVSLDGVCSLSTTVPQCLLVAEFPYELGHRTRAGAFS